MIRPSMQFYPRDWLAHPGLRMCSLQARGLWIDMMALMHSGEPYGYLNHKGKDILPPVLARIVGVSIGEIEGCLTELREHGVVSQTEDGTLFSGRMVKDEYNRQVRAAGGVRSLDNPNVPQPRKDILPIANDPSFRPSPASAVASASSTALTATTESEKNKDGYPADFELIWKAYPRRTPASNKAGTYRLFKQHLKSGVAYDVMFEGTKRYAAACIARGIVGTEFVKDAKTFFGRDKHFLDDHSTEGPPQIVAVGGVPTPDELRRMGIKLA